MVSTSPGPACDRNAGSLRAASVVDPEVHAGDPHRTDGRPRTRQTCATPCAPNAAGIAFMHSASVSCNTEAGDTGFAANLAECQRTCRPSPASPHGEPAWHACRRQIRVMPRHPAARRRNRCGTPAGNAIADAGARHRSSRAGRDFVRSGCSSQAHGVAVDRATEVRSRCRDERGGRAVVRVAARGRPSRDGDQPGGRPPAGSSFVASFRHVGGRRLRSATRVPGGDLHRTAGMRRAPRRRPRVCRRRGAARRRGKGDRPPGRRSL